MPPRKSTGHLHVCKCTEIYSERGKVINEYGNKAGYDTAPNKNKKFGTNFEFLVKKVNSIIIEI